MEIAGLQASWLKIRWTTISSQPHTHLPNTEFSTKQSPTQHPKRSQPQNTDQMPNHADFPSWRLNCFGIWDVNLFRGKALEKDRVQSSFHNKCRLQMLRVDIFGWIFPVTLASLISRSPIFAWREWILCVGYTMYKCMSPHVSTLNIYFDSAHLWRNWWRYIAPIDCIPNSCCQSRRKNGIDPPLALIVVLLRVSTDHLGVDPHPRQARAQGDQRIKRADCSQACLPRLCWSDLKP